MLLQDMSQIIVEKCRKEQKHVNRNKDNNEDVIEVDEVDDAAADIVKNKELREKRCKIKIMRGIKMCLIM